MERVDGSNTNLVLLDRATQMLAEVRSVDDAKKIIDLAEAARVYAKQVKLGLEAQNHGAEIKIRAQRRAGEILREMEKNKGSQNQLVGPGVIGPYREEAPIEQPPTYAELDITYKDAHVWQTLAAMDAPVFERFIEERRDAVEEITTAAVYREAKRFIAQNKPNAPELPTGKYRVIYADPPWSYSNSGLSQSAASHYPTMATEAICAVPVPERCGAYSVLFLWATSPLLPDALEVVEAWGFNYKASMIWDKGQAPSIGWFVQTEHEFLLIATREGNPHPAIRPKSVLRFPLGRHSAKPSEVYETIERMYCGPYLELFARNERTGWDSWGNEVGCGGNSESSDWGRQGAEL